MPEGWGCGGEEEKEGFCGCGCGWGSWGFLFGSRVDWVVLYLRCRRIGRHDCLGLIGMENGKGAFARGRIFGG